MTRTCVWVSVCVIQKVSKLYGIPIVSKMFPECFHDVPTSIIGLVNKGRLPKKTLQTWSFGST